MSGTEWRKAVHGDRDRECVWVAAGEIAHRICRRGFECTQCEFDQMIVDYPAEPVNESIEIRAAA